MLSSPSSVPVVCTLQHGWPLKVFFFPLFVLPTSLDFESFSKEHTVLYNLIPVQLLFRLYIWCVAHALNSNRPTSNLLMFLVFCIPLPALQKRPEEINRRSADMWSFAVLLWELVTREVPFADLSHMEIGMKVNQHKHLSTYRLILASTSLYLLETLHQTPDGSFGFLCLFLCCISPPPSLLRWLSKVFGQQFHRGFHLISVS